MKSFPTHIAWEGGMQHNNFVSLQEPYKSNELYVAVESYSLSIVPDEHVYLGYMEIVTPFELTNKKIKINIEMSQTTLYSTGHYLQSTLTKDSVIHNLIINELSRKKTLSYASLEQEFIQKNFEVPHIRQVGDMTCLVVPKNKYCRLFFNNMIDIKHFSTDNENVYNLSDAKHWLKLLYQPIFGLRLQVNNSSGEARVVKYTKNIDGLDHQVSNLAFTSFETKEVNKLRIQVVDPTGNVLQTIGDCFQNKITMSFYMTLPSNASSNHYNNKQSNYTTKLDNPLSFQFLTR